MQTQNYVCENCGKCAVDWKGNTTKTCSKCESVQNFKCTKCKSGMTDTGDEYVCDNESCGWNLDRVK